MPLLRQGRHSSLIILILCTVPADWTTALEPAPSFTGPQLEFFEKQIRPLLSNRCYACHSHKSKKLKANLRLDSRAAVLRGGDTGPAAIAGKAAKSLLIDAINYGETYQMPPQAKLPKAEIAALTRWVEMGLPWPQEAPPGDPMASDPFDLAERQQQHWSWGSLQSPGKPSVKNDQWPSDDLDHFILARLEKKQLSPAPPASREQLLRRVHLDLTGLPPTPTETANFLADQSPQAYEKLVDRLLQSPHFGERWGRHWLDLVRYAESRGHEFDYNVANAYQYRDYVIRALNEDVPYDQFVREHIAGDLLPTPRLHPREGFNESILGTGFWFLGEWVHSPVDIRQDELDRYDNMIDVMSKTFLGLTVSCARCHNHKFDAISQQDYYALAGYLQSSGYRQARFDTLHRNRLVAQQLHKLHEEADLTLAQALFEAQQPTIRQLNKILLFIERTYPTLPAKADSRRVIDTVFSNFESGTYGDWKATGTAFGDRPNTQQTIGKYQGDVKAVGKFFVNSHSQRVKAKVTHSDEPQGTLTSPDFIVKHDFIRLHVGGGSHRSQTCINLLIDDRVVESVTGKNSNQMHVQWIKTDKYKSKTGRLEVLDRHSGGWGNISVDDIVFTNQGPPGKRPTRSLSPSQRTFVAAAAKAQGLSAAITVAWFDYLLKHRDDQSEPFYPWSRLALTGDNNRPAANRIQDELKRWSAQGSSANSLATGAKILVDYNTLPAAHYKNNGFAFGLQPLKPGSLIWSNDPAAPIQRVIGRSTSRRDPIWASLKERPGQAREPGALGKYVRAGQTHRTTTFTVTAGPVHILLRGSGHIYAAVDSHAVIQGPLHGALTRQFKDVDGKLQWATMNLTAYRGHRVHLEITGTGNVPTAILGVVESARPPVVPDERADPLTALKNDLATVSTLEQLATEYASGLQLASRAWTMQSKALTPPMAALATWINRHPELFYLSDQPRLEKLQKVSRAAFSARQDIVSKISYESRLAPAMLDGTPEDEFLLIRGNHKTTNGNVPRRLLTALGGKPQAGTKTGSGRRELADDILSPANPYTSRVMVNRIWHHLFGRGIVPSTNNFGVLGQRPTHPQLLDHLASRFIGEGWSVKRMIKTIVLSQTYRMSSSSNPQAIQIDATNQLLHHKPVKRLEGEVIRDQLLTLSGRLDRKMFGPSVPIFLNEFMQGRGRPGNGPLDGQGRRSIYLSVRRNFLHPMLLTFDMPIPFNSMGRRNVSNVPAQSLILMNDPFVVSQAELWAKQLLADPQWKTLDPGQRIDARLQHVYLSAFCRPPNAGEKQRLSQFLQSQGEALNIPVAARADDVRIWKDLVHIVVNTKEFIFIE